MRITEVVIRNFRCHENTRIKLQKYHALVGENGTGKTAILEAIDLATAPHLSSFRFSEQDFNNIDQGDIFIEAIFDRFFVVRIPDGYTTQSLPCKSVVLTVKRRQQASAGKVLSDPFVVSHTCKPITYSKKSELESNLLPDEVSLNDLPESVLPSAHGYSITRKSGTTMGVRGELIGVGGDVIGFPNVFFFDREREKECKVGFNTLFSRMMRELNWRFRRNWDPSHIRELWEPYYSEILGTVEKKVESELLGPVRERLAEILGPPFDELELSLLALEEPFTKAFLALRNELNQVDMTRVGSGISTMVAYLLLEQMASLTKQSVIFLIDEPEMHLHPQMQKYLAEHFQAGETQVVISTHSPLFVDVGQWKGISRLTMTGDVKPTEKRLAEHVASKTIIEHLEEIPKWHQHETVFLESDSELFFARKALVVEGPAEKYGLPRLAKIIGKTFKDVTIISCNGKNKIPYYAILCQAFDIPAYVLFDLDGEDLKHEKNSSVALMTKSLPRSFFSTNFEQLLGISPSSKHKGSDVLLRIDQISTTDEIPKEIAQAIEEIAQWAGADHNDREVVDPLSEDEQEPNDLEVPF